MKPEGTLITYGRKEAIQIAYDLGHQYELNAHYCPQASLAALMDVFHMQDDTLFRSVFGFHGGSGNRGIGPCGALVGGIAAIGYFFDFSREEDKKLFEESRGHEKCAQVVGKGAALAAAVLWDALHEIEPYRT